MTDTTDLGELPKARVYCTDVEWRPVPGYEGLYEVSDDGQVQGIKRGRPLKMRAQPSGHLSVCLSRHPHEWNAPVHRLVLLAFVGPPPAGTEARHYPDRDPTNNRLKNLSWATRLVNVHDRTVHGTENIGERHGQAKLTWDAVRDIWAMSGSLSQRELATIFGVHQTTVQRVLSGKRWKRAPPVGPFLSAIEAGRTCSDVLIARAEGRTP